MTDTNATLKDRIDRLFELRRRKAELQAEVTEINKEIDEVEYYTLGMLEDLGIDKASTERGTVTLSAGSYPQVTDMEAFATWCAETGNTGMLQKRITAAYFKEYFEETGELPPGTDTYEKRTLSYRKK